MALSINGADFTGWHGGSAMSGAASTGIEAAQAVLRHRPQSVTGIFYIHRNRIVNRVIADFPIPAGWSALGPSPTEKGQHT